MPAVINTNLASMFAQQSLNNAQGNLATSVQRLSSGLRINSAKDDAAGLSVAQNMQSQLNAVNMSSRNIGDATNMLATADSSLGSIQDMLLRMKSLIVEGKNDSLSTTQRKNIYTEMAELNTEINKVATRTTFNGNSLLSSQGVIATAGGSDVKVGTSGSATVGFGVNSVVSSINYSGTQAANYNFTAAAGGTNVTLTNATTNVAQIVALGADRTAGSSTLTFDTFGITIGLTHTGTTTAANIVTAVTDATTTRRLVVTNAGPAAMAFQSGSANNDLFNFQTLNVQTDANAATGAYATFKTRIDALRDATDTAGYNTAFDNMNTSVDLVVDDINTKRALFGSQMNRVSVISNQLLAQSSNIQQSRSSIIDTDFAAETARLTKGQIMQQAATAMLAQANQMPNVILSLLK
jgi:flagellin